MYVMYEHVMSLMNHDCVKFMEYVMWIITVNRKLNSLNSLQETNLKHDRTVIKLCDMLRNFYEIMLLRKLCELYELCDLFELWKQVFKKVVFEPLNLIDFENI